MKRRIFILAYALVACTVNSGGFETETCRWFNHSKMYLNKRLDHHSMTSLMTSSLSLCLDACMLRTNCFSINYERESKTCELLKVNSTAESLFEIGYVHLGLEDWLQVLTPFGTSLGHFRKLQHTSDVCKADGHVTKSCILLGGNSIRYRSPCSVKPCGLKQFCVPIFRQETFYDCFDIEHDDCEEVYLVSGPYGVPDDQLTASSVEQNNTSQHGAHRARLNHTSSWDPGTEPGCYIQVQFNKTRIVVGVVTQGAHYTEAWVENYQVAYSANCVDFDFVMGIEGMVKVFDGNYDNRTPRTNYFEDKLSARCVRIYPTDSHVFIVMRFDVIGCA